MNRRLALVLPLIAALAAACQDVTAPSAQPTDRPAGPTPVVTTYQPDTRVWASGFEITVVDVTARLDAKGGPVTVHLRIANPGNETATLEAPIRLTASGAAFEPVHGTSLPPVPGHAVTDVRVEFEVTGRSSIADGVLRIGRSADHQAQVPFGPGAVRVVTLEPLTSKLAVSRSSPNLRLAVRQAVLRWDLPDWYDELPLAVATVGVTYDVTYIGTFAGGASFTSVNIALKLPDGRLVAPRADGHSQSILLLRPNRTVRNAFSRFEIPNGVTGDFALVIRDEGRQVPIPFTIGP